MAIVITPAVALLIQLSVEALIRQLTSKVNEMTEEELDAEIVKLKAEKDVAMTELTSH